MVDGLTAANDLGLTDAVPTRIGVLTDGRLRPITLGNLTLDFQAAAPSRLYWAGRPAMRFVQAFYWLRDMLPSDDGSLRKRLVSILKDPDHGQGHSGRFAQRPVGAAGVDAGDCARPAQAGDRWSAASGREAEAFETCVRAGPYHQEFEEFE